jgi:3-methyl-2-oxobutanoate hydroxymethyltransferase
MECSMAASSPKQKSHADRKADELRPMTIPEFVQAKSQGLRLTVLTAYDFTMARLFQNAGVDALLVGDSLGMVVQGHENSLSVTMEEMIYHSRLVARGAPRCLVITDMPFMSYQISPQQALENAGRLLKEGKAHAVKVEGGRRTAAAIAAITAADIPVMGHVGMTPQSVHRFGGFLVQRDEPKLIDDALAVQEAGAFAVVVECVPAETAAKITQALKVPTIGIGAGATCDGQVLVAHDMLGLFDDFHPRFAKQFADLGPTIQQAAESYCREVRAGTFPGPEHSYR